MFQVVHKDHLYLNFFENQHFVYDVKKDADTNQIMFLFYNEKDGWHYVAADDYIPINNDVTI